MNITPTPTTNTKQYIEVRVNPTSDVFLFDCDQNKQHVWLYVKDTASLHFDKRYQYFINHHSTCANIHITTDQWNHFIKRLSLLAAPIRSKVTEQLNINISNTFTFKRPDSTILMVKCYHEPIPSIEIYDTESEYYNGTLLNSTDYMVPYDPQLDEYISRFMKELRETMNQWLHLNQSKQEL